MAILNSFIYDYLARQKVGGINLNSYHLYQLPVHEFPSEKENYWSELLYPRVFELTYTSFALSPLAQDYYNTTLTHGYC